METGLVADPRRFRVHGDGHYPLIKAAIADGRIPELSSAARYTFVYPEFPERQRYSRIELLQSFSITTTDGDKDCCFVFGQCIADGQWEIVSASIRGDDGTWHELEVLSKPHTDRVSLATKERT